MASWSGDLTLDTDFYSQAQYIKEVPANKPSDENLSPRLKLHFKTSLNISPTVGDKTANSKSSTMVYKPVKSFSINGVTL